MRKLFNSGFCVSVSTVANHSFIHPSIQMSSHAGPQNSRRRRRHRRISFTVIKICRCFFLLLPLLLFVYHLAGFYESHWKCVYSQSVSQSVSLCIQNVIGTLFLSHLLLLCISSIIPGPFFVRFFFSCPSATMKDARSWFFSLSFSLAIKKNAFERL